MRHTRSTPFGIALALVGAVCLFAAGCARPGAAQSEPAVDTVQVDLPPSYKFAPASIRVSSGSTVTWTNHDNFTHSVQINGQTDVHMLTPGQATQITFSTPGEYDYVCTLHTQNMRGHVTVT
jgi:plastocyanin